MRIENIDGFEAADRILSACGYPSIQEFKEIEPKIPKDANRYRYRNLYFGRVGGLTRGFSLDGNITYRLLRGEMSQVEIDTEYNGSFGSWYRCQCILYENHAVMQTEYSDLSVKDIFEIENKTLAAELLMLFMR